MEKFAFRYLNAFVLLLLAGCTLAQGYRLEPVAEGFSQPLGLTTDGVNAERLYVIEKTGAVRVIEDGELWAEPFLDVSGQISTNSERGLLDIAFDPDYAENGLVFVHYSDAEGATTLSSFSVNEDGTQLLLDSETVLLSVPQPYPNHNGGELEFGPDGYLYMALGDGGAGGDPQRNGQNLGTLLGAILRLDVASDAYTVPEDNPFVYREGAAPELWAYGLRNPWRFSFDRETGDLWIADVGQNQWEEVNLQAAESPGGENYGWNIMEGTHCYETESCEQEGLVLPVIEYSHASGDGSSITGGYVYRGEALPELAGAYIFGDYGSGNIWRATETDGIWAKDLLLGSGMNVTSFGQDEAGELYVVSIGGGVYRLSAGQ